MSELNLPRCKEIDHLMSWHHEELEESRRILLHGLPEDETREMLSAMITEAFLAGMVAQERNPAP
jgi:DNA-nicking Smr family endonuclease